MAGYIGSKAAVVSSGAERKKTFDITTSTTSLTGLSYTVGQVHVFHNGVRLVDGTDYTATNSTSITLTAAAENGDQVVVVSYATFQTSDTVSASAGGTFAGAVDVNAAGNALTLDRTGSDGTILDLKRDGSTVGSIGTEGGNIFFEGGANKTGVRVSGSSILPRDNGVDVDGAVSLGQSALRFKDLYLSGGVYLGGTGSANKLDDYEVGTFTPTITGVTTAPTVSYVRQDGNYTKVGNIVHCNIYLQTSSRTGGSGDLRIRGLPFTSLAVSPNREFYGSVLGYAISSGRTQLDCNIFNNSTELAALGGSNNTNWMTVPITGWGAGTTAMRISISYQVS